MRNLLSNYLQTTSNHNEKIFENKKNYHFYNRDGIWILTNKELLKKMKMN